ncbi:protein-disulfide reductase DsbD family protein [Uliginosibacterium sp. H1]|uniref:protein-disulfide reductase DsbD family protein n=1 Tax=Uliginosibacterium sp. H1 TaxID=3114757 RepID=UPI002E1824FD|nr:protein-disulfide reductase DsbD domain-containing protein [Uliginosibacterium sp. H1]
MSIRLWLLVCLLGLTRAAWAQDAHVLQTPHVRASLVTLQQAVVPGQPLRAGLRIEHAPGWHTYWRNPGDSGEPPTLTWNLPEGFSAGEIEWPAPHALPVGPLTNYGYEGDHLLPVSIAVPAGLTAPGVTLRLAATWLVCQVKCIPEEGEFELRMPVAAQAAAGPLQPLFAGVDARRPQAVAGWTLSANRHEGHARLVVRTPGEAGVSQAQYFPYGEGLVEASGRQVLQVDAAGFTLDVPPAVQPVGPLDRLHGLLVVEDADGRARVLEVDASVDAPVSAAPVVSPAPSGGLWGALLLAFLGGAILNLMPCVFPVLSIKLLALAKDEQPRQARMHAAAYAVGVVASFLLLALLLIGLRAAGHQLGWGFQLQSPAFVVALAMLFFVMGLNLSGVFEFGQAASVGAGKHQGAAQAFGTGVLAVFAASPCTAPFMGAALGYAIGQSAWQALWVFAFLGLGMALPFVALACWSRARRWLPKPGAWMQRFKQALAFPLYATTVWLAWVLGEQRGAGAMAWLGMALVLVACAAWAWRQRQGGGGRAWQFVSVAVLACTLAVLLQAARDDEGGERGATASARGAADSWAVWSPQAVQEHLAAGRGVFVDFTAAWCVTCQVNKRLVLHREDVRDAFARAGFVPLRADWTRYDPAITQALDALGRKGVPVYVVQRPGQAPVLLPEILTPDIVLDALTETSP